MNKFKSVEKKLCTKMFPLAQTNPVNPATEDVHSEDDEDVIPLEKLEEYRELYHDEFRLALKGKWGNL